MTARAFGEKAKAEGTSRRGKGVMRRRESWRNAARYDLRVSHGWFRGETGEGGV